MDSGPQSEFGWAQQDVTNLNARGLGLGETPLRRWEAVTVGVRSRAPPITKARRHNAKLGHWGGVYRIGSVASVHESAFTKARRHNAKLIYRGTTPRLTSVGYTDRCREVLGIQF
jgi:hypothetical protein